MVGWVLGTINLATAGVELTVVYCHHILWLGSGGGLTKVFECFITLVWGIQGWDSFAFIKNYMVLWKNVHHRFRIFWTKVGWCGENPKNIHCQALLLHFAILHPSCNSDTSVYTRQPQTCAQDRSLWSDWVHVQSSSEELPSLSHRRWLYTHTV